MDVSQQEVAHAVEANLVAWYSDLGRLPGYSLHRDRDVTRLFSTRREYANTAVGFRFTKRTADRRLDEITDCYRKHRKEAEFLVGPSSRPAGLDQRLRARGLLCREHWPGMACDLSKINGNLPRPQRLECRVLEDHSIFADGRLEHPMLGLITIPTRRRYLENRVALAKTRPQCVWHFLATLEEEPIGVATLCLGRRTACIYEVGVVKRARRRGIGTSVTLYACRFARDLGYRTAVLLATGPGMRMYRRLGFSVVCRINQWYLPKARQNMEVHPSEPPVGCRGWTESGTGE